MKRCLLFLLTIMMIMTSVTFAGCGQRPPIPGDEKTMAVAGTPTPCRCQPTLFVWWDQAEDDITLLQDAWYDFKEIYKMNYNAINAGHTNHVDRVSMFSMAGDVNGTTQLEQQVMSGTAPDLVRMDHVYITALGQKGLVYDLQERFNATIQLKDKFVTSAWEASTSGDAVYGIPFDANTIIFGAKTSVLQQAGVSIPTTYEELRTAGTEMNALNLEQKPYFLPMEGFSGMSPMGTYFMTWLWRLGGDLLNEDLTEAVFNDKETGVEALNMIVQLRKDGMLATDAHEDGKTVMSDYGTWWMNSVETDMEFSLQPQLKEGISRYSGLGLYSLAVVTTATEAQVAYDFAVHLATEQNSADKKHYVYTYCRNHSLIPALKAAITTSEIWDADSAEGEFWRVSTEQLALSKYRPAVPCWPEIEEALTTAIYQTLLGEKTAQQALDDAAEVANRLLDQWHASGNTESEG